MKPKAMPRLRGRARVVVFNLAGVAVGLSVLALAAEGWTRSKAEFGRRKRMQLYVHPTAGQLYLPGSEARFTNMLDFWTVSRVNRWGFLDRPPPTNSANEPSCRVAVVGDSFVDAREVPVSDKLHVRLEEMAHERLPALGVAASAYGMSSTGQINQLGFYDEFVSRTSPNVVVLVFVINDFFDNFPVLQAYSRGDSHPDQIPWITATRAKDGSFELRPPALHLKKRGSGVWDTLRYYRSRVVDSSYFLVMLSTKKAALTAAASAAKGPAAGREALEYTAFALDQWRARARRDGFLLVILATHTVGEHGLAVFEHLERMASARDIPVVDQFAYVMRRNSRIQDLHFAHDLHWNATGHQRAAEALLEWLERNRDACARGGPPDPHE